MNQPSALQSITNTRASYGAPSRVSIGKYNNGNIRSQRHSVAPQNMRRTSSGKSENRYSHGKRLSAGSGRRSSGYGVGPRVQSTRKDPRPLTDRMYMNESIKVLIVYLGKHGYNRKLSGKILTAPSIRDFMNILQFLAARISPEFRWNHEKPELQVASFFKTLKYPFPINRSAVLSVGSPHSWSQLLGALMWLIELLEYQEMLDHKYLGMGDVVDDSSEDKVFFEYLSRAYSSYMAGSDEYKALEEDVQQSFLEKSQQLQQQIAEQDGRLRQLQKEADQYAGYGNRVGRLQQRKQALADDIKKFENYVEKLENQREAVLAKIEEEKGDVIAKEEEVKSLAEEKERLAAVVASQEITATDVQRMMTQRNNLDATQRSLISQKENAKKTAWELETKLTKQVTVLEDMIAQYNQMAAKIKLVPMQNKYADGSISYDLQLNVNAVAEEEILNIDVKGSLRPALQKLKENLYQTANKKQEKLVQLHEMIDRVEESCSDLSDDALELEAQLKKIETTYSLEKQARSEEIRRQASKAESIQAQVSKKKLTSQEQLANAQESLEMLEMEAEELNRSLENERAAINEKIVDALTMLVEHKQFISEQLMELEDQYETAWVQK